MNLHGDHLEDHRRELTERLERDRAEIIRAAQGLQPPLQKLDRAEKRVRAAAEALPVIAWGLAELILAIAAARYAARTRSRPGWLMLGLQAFRLYRTLRTPAAPIHH